MLEVATDAWVVDEDKVDKVRVEEKSNQAIPMEKSKVETEEEEKPQAYDPGITMDPDVRYEADSEDNETDEETVCLPYNGVTDLVRGSFLYCKLILWSA